MKKRILVACGSGIATSTVVTAKVEALLAEHGIQANVEQINISEAKSKQSDADLIVSTTMLPTTYDIPSVVATGYLSGINTEDIDKAILSALKGD